MSDNKKAIVESKCTGCKYTLKLLIIGNSKVGKSALLTRFTTNEFSSQYAATIGVEFVLFIKIIGS